jgi:hypothetical protein
MGMQLHAEGPMGGLDYAPLGQTVRGVGFMFLRRLAPLVI